MFITVNTGAVVGLEGTNITVEVDISKSWPGFQIIGLADTIIQESKERIRIAWKNSGLTWPQGRGMIINLAPAHTRKEGARFDLPIAVGMYLADKGINDSILSDALLIGELALDGKLRPVSCILPLMQFAIKQKYSRVFVPALNAAEASLMPNITVHPVHSLKEMIEHLQGNRIPKFISKKTKKITCLPNQTDVDFSLIHGQEFAKRALEIAASGFHNVLLSGPPGSGKTLLARSVPSILPSMDPTESLEVTKIYSVAGLLKEQHPLVTERPFRAPHHSASGVALVGGGKFPRPGEISLAHRGVLFLDELPEFSRAALEHLRQPLEDGLVTIARTQGTLTFPSRFILIASQNPCPCGFASDQEKHCSCSPNTISNYQRKVSGPLLDRIDLHIEVPRVPFEKLTGNVGSESSASIRERVIAAHERQKHRFKNSPIRANGEMSDSEIKKFCVLDESTLLFLKEAAAPLRISARSYYKILKIARTIADLKNYPAIQIEHVAEALQYRTKN